MKGNDMEKVLCIYHGNCADGFGAAWAVRHALRDGVEFHAGVYQTDPPDVTGRDVVLVDFSYKRDVLDNMVKLARSILVLDHHKSAMEDLKGFGYDEGKSGSYRHWREYQDSHECPKNHGCLFDMDRSGAMIAWDFFHPGEPAPQLLKHIQDRDLWKFDLEGTREIQANVFSHPYDFNVWDSLMAADVSDLIAGGAAIERKHHKDVAELVKVTQRPMVIGGYKVPVANVPYTLTSDAGHLMCQPYDGGMDGCCNHPFAACYWDTPDGRVFSLRSDKKWDGADVSQIAAKYGGGGHKHAAGFRMPIGWEGDGA